MKNISSLRHSWSARSDDDKVATAASLARKKQKQKQYTAKAKTYGAIEGVEVFATWETNQELADSSVHRRTQGGIFGNAREGVFSILLSDKYEDDEDKGDYIIYTGVGGRLKRGGRQTSNQTWSRTENAAFQTSLRQGNDVRVVRSSKCRSKYAPPEGFRYDGLYKVVDCQIDLVENGKQVCHSELRRLPDQPPIPVRTR